MQHREGMCDCISTSTEVLHQEFIRTIKVHPKKLQDFVQTLWDKNKHRECGGGGGIFKYITILVLSFKDFHISKGTVKLLLFVRISELTNGI